jgi:hypothetical protein
MHERVVILMGRHFRRRPWKLAAAAVLAGAVAAIVVQVVAGGGNRVQIGDGSVSALARKARAGDALPASVLALPFGERNFASPSGAGTRLLRTEGSLSLYAVPGKGRLVCLVEVDNAAQTAGGACADRKVLLTGSIFMADVRDDGRKDVVGLVGDGHTFAEADGRRVPTDNNVFVIRGVESKDVTLGSPTATQTVAIED